MKAVEIKKGIYWVGGIDWDLRNFHGYVTQKGSSYNAFLIIDEKITLIDTVKSYLCDEMLTRIRSIVDPAKIDTIICNHVEMDHSGSIPRIMEICPNAVIYTSPNGEKGLRDHYKKDWNFKVVNSGDSISLGKRTLNFVLTPMVHWPDNMVSYLAEEKILFSNDAFGQHIASSERIDHEYPLTIILEEAKKYYANIVLPYSAQVAKAMEEAGKLDIDMIAPSHGIIWEKHIPEILAEYAKWSSNQTQKQALIVYDTMWHSTEKMAYSIQSAFEEKGYKTTMHNLQYCHISDVMTSLITAEYICVGSPTLNKNMLPTVAAFLTYLKGLSPKNRKALAFGSYGWGSMALKKVEADLLECGFELLPKIEQKFIPSESDLAKILATLADQIK
jgi:flavorubredoxin